MRRLALLSLLTLAGCGHDITLMGPDGTVGTGTASSGVGSGDVKLALAGENYTGRWAAVQSSGGASNSDGTVIAASDKGGTLKCQFTYGGFTFAGFGHCRDKGGKDYDLQIH